VDVTVFKDGVHGDTSRTILIGDSTTMDKERFESLTRLMDTCLESLHKAIAVCKPGEKFSKIGSTIEPFIQSKGYYVVPYLFGHGIGKYFHEEPYVSHSKQSGFPDSVMREGMTFTIGKKN
jgi:methionyl aminopeptidase